MMEANQEYFVFISYSSMDNEWAIWLRHELEHYHLPASFNGRTDVRDNLRKVFRDRDELSAGPEWDEQVGKALATTNNLIVICSPNAAKSETVNKEVEAFIALGKEDYIFPFIVEGEKPEDCFPPALKHSKLGGDVNKDGGRDSAFVKVVAGMLIVGFPSLWDRYEKEKAEEERKIREQRDKLLVMQSRFLAEKANDLVDEGDSYMARLLALEALPKDLENPDRPYVPEAEAALRNALSCDTVKLGGNALVKFVIVDPEGRYLYALEGNKDISIYDISTGQIRKCIDGRDCISLSFTSNGWIEKHMNNGEVQILNPYHFICSEVRKENNQDLVQQRKARVIRNASFSFNTSSGQFDVSVDGEWIFLKKNSHEGKGTIISNKKTCKSNKDRRDKKKQIFKEVFSPDGNMKVRFSYSMDLLEFCDLRNKKTRRFGGFHGRFYPLAFSDEGEKKILRMQDLRILQNEEIVEDGFRDDLLEEDLHDFYPGFHFVTFSNDGKYIASASQDRTIRIFNTKDLNLECLIITDRVVGPLSFSQDNSLLASCSDKMQIWDRISGVCLQTFDCCEDRAISLIWDDGNKKSHVEVEYVSRTIQTFFFPPLQQLINKTRDQFEKRLLTPEERKKYYLD